MKSMTVVAAGFVAVGFGVVSYIMIRIEPGMGFATPADYFDPVKVTAGYASVPWLVVNLLYLLFPVALFVLAKSSAQERFSAFGLAAAAAGLFLGIIDRVAIQLPSLLPSDKEVHAAVAAMLPIRLAVLKTTVVMLGLFAWRTTRASDGHGVGMRSWRVLGWVVLAVSIAFLFVFIPAPIAFCVWAAGLTVKATLDKGDASKTHPLDEGVAA
jgi:hypothetical protein